MHGVARLERRHLRPAFFEKHRPCFRRAMVEPGVGFGEMPFRDRADGTTEIDRPLIHDLGHAGMRGIRRAEYVRALELPVNRILFVDAQDAQQLPGFAILERNVFTDLDAVTQRLATGQRDRNGPEHAVGECHVFTAPSPVSLAHKAVERRVRAHPQHEQVGHFARRQGHSFQALGALRLSGPFRLWQEQWVERVGAMRRYETDHFAYL